MRVSIGLSAAFTAAGLLAPCFGSPTGNYVRRDVQHDEQVNVDKREHIVFTDPNVAAPTEVPQAIVYVDENGGHVRTATRKILLVPAPTDAGSVGEPGLEPPPVDPPQINGGDAPATDQVATPDSAPAPDQSADPEGSPSDDEPAEASSDVPSNSLGNRPSSSENSGNGLFGIAYAPYSASGECKTADQIETDLATFKGRYSLVRIYGTDCDQVSKVYPAAKKAGLKLFLGLFELDGVQEQVNSIVAAVDDWSLIDTVSVGNERVNNGEKDIGKVLSAVRQTRSLLRAAGYDGPVVTVDTFVAVGNHPVLCDESDYCAMNIHPFFDGNVPPEGAGEFIIRMVSHVQSKLANPSQRIVVTETGWPWQGTVNRAAIPGRSQQHVAIDAIKAAYASHTHDLILFSAFNDPWKPAEANTFYAEQFWGIDGIDSPY